MWKSSRNKLIFAAAAVWLPNVFCSTGYITPASLTATAAVPENSPVPTAFFVFPTETPTPPPTNTSTPDPSLATSTPEHDPTPAPSPSPTVTDAPLSGDTPPLQYTAQSGDTLAGLASRFGVNTFEIVSSSDIPQEGLIDPGQFFLIPARFAETTSDNRLMPDSEVVYSPTTLDFDTVFYINITGGKASQYEEFINSNGKLSAAAIIQKIAIENSINPRLLVSLLEYQGNWVLGSPTTISKTDYPLGYIHTESKGLHKQLLWVVNQLSAGYYGWRDGSLTHLTFKDGRIMRIAPTLNAGTVAVQYLFSQVYTYEAWQQVIDPAAGFAALHTTLFDDPWARAAGAEPILPPTLEQPKMILPFLIGQRWAFTGGPHGAWGATGSQAAIDFAPGSTISGCASSENYVTAAAPGIVSRVGTGVVVLDLDGDGKENTGWALVYLHLKRLDSITVGMRVEKSDLLGFPSCEGGSSTGTHLHIARKYNGEWIAAGGPLPFVLGGWETVQGDGPYQGSLVRGDETIIACTCGSFETNIYRTEEDE
ncbi:MAG: LysM peptidoglycan-binding domain-containing M23 family metallopeptidase [Anaerolineae bacterium]|nr:LysM peptidoglycan-binding domain-containing M23 family metallopeptidase [Anaerolineae bacterium]